MSHQNLLLGLDVGTTNIKCLAIDDSGAILAEAAVPTPASHPQPGWTDFEPGPIWQTACRAIQLVVSKLPSGDSVKGIAVGSVAESLVPVGADGEPLASAIAWFDTRTASQYDWLCQRVGYDRLFEMSGLNPDPMFGICKALWLRQHNPSAFQKTRYWLHLADYIAFRLSGVPATDPSLACRTLAYNIRRGVWDKELLNDAGMDPASFPPILKSGTALGPVTESAAAATTLPRTAIVSVGVHDHVGGAFAASGLSKEVLVDSIGSSEMLLSVSDQASLDPAIAQHGMAQGAVWIDRPIYYLTGGIFTAGSAIDWFRRELGGNANFEDLTHEAAKVECDTLIFLPHLVRSLTPYPDTQVSGAFIGLNPTTSRGHMFRAVLEGIAFEARGIVDAMVTIAGQVRPTQIITIGATLQNRLLAQIKADIFGSKLMINPIRETVSFGAALVAGLGSGVFTDASQAVSVARRHEIRLDPDQERSKRLIARYEEVYRDLFLTLQSVNHRLNAAPRRAGS
jgi:xylulokinase